MKRIHVAQWRGGNLRNEGVRVLKATQGPQLWFVRLWVNRIQGICDECSIKPAEKLHLRSLTDMTMARMDQMLAESRETIIAAGWDCYRVTP